MNTEFQFRNLKVICQIGNLVERKNIKMHFKEIGYERTIGFAWLTIRFNRVF